MKTKLTVAQTIVSILLLLFLGVTFSACKSTPKVDWNSRVGNFTYDQAVAELGPPDKSAKLTDGNTVADWIKHSGGGMSFGVGTGFYGSHSAVGVGQSVGTGYADKVLRLTFGPDHKLVSWSKNY
jgi:hypothetical protein